MQNNGDEISNIKTQHLKYSFFLISEFLWHKLACKCDANGVPFKINNFKEFIYLLICT